MSTRYIFNPLEGEFDAIDISEFITEGDDGITTIRMESATKIWDFTVDDTGAWVATEVVFGAVPVWFTLLPQ